jgi:hypothetical protein
VTIGPGHALALAVMLVAAPLPSQTPVPDAVQRVHRDFLQAFHEGNDSAMAAFVEQHVLGGAPPQRARAVGYWRALRTEVGLVSARARTRDARRPTRLPGNACC